MLALLGSLLLPLFALLGPATCQSPQSFKPVKNEEYHIVTEIEGFGLDKRATQYFITIDGRATYDCHAATTFLINPNQELIAGNGQMYGTDSGVTSQQFTPSDYPRSISTTWQVSQYGVVTWNNPEFQNGVAVACVDQQMNLQIYFLATPPATCTILTFRTAGLSICPSSSTTLAPSPTMAANPPPVQNTPSPSPTTAANPPPVQNTPSPSPTTAANPPPVQNTPSPSPTTAANPPPVQNTPSPSTTTAMTPAGTSNARPSGMAFRAYPVYTNQTSGNAFSPSSYISTCYPWQYGVASAIEFNNTQDYYCTPPGFVGPISCNNMVELIQGYFYANTAGTYMFFSADTEDYFWVWQKNALGTLRTSSNQDMLGLYQQPNNVTFTFAANSYNAFTFMWVSQQNSRGPALIDFKVQLPGATQTVDITPYMSLPTGSEFDCPYPVAGSSSYLNIDQYYTGLGFRGYLGDDSGTDVSQLNGNCATNATGIAYNLDFYVANDSGNCYPPGALTAQNCSAYRAIYQGYFYAEVNGPYTFSTANPEDFLGVWVGVNASSTNWTPSNYVLKTGSTPAATNGTITLSGGMYIPITIIAINMNPAANEPGFRIDLRVSVPGIPYPLDPTYYYYRPKGTAGEFDCPYNAPP